MQINKPKVVIYKKIVGIIILSTFFSCAAKHTFKFDPTSEDSYKPYSKALKNAHYLEDDEVWLVFYSGFNQTQISLKENNRLRFDTVLTTKNVNPKLAKVCKIHNSSQIEINSVAFKKRILINGKDMKYYKSIYISKKGRKTEIHFTNAPIFRIDEHNRTAKGYKKYIRKTINDSLKALKK